MNLNIQKDQAGAYYDLRLPPGLENSNLPVVLGVIEAGKQHDTEAVINGILAAENVARELGIDLYPGKGLSSSAAAH